MAKKIGAIVSVSIIGILILATIIMANINVNYSINCANPDAIYVQYGSNAQITATDSQYNEILNYINNASKGNSLEALFSGNLFTKAEITTVRTYTTGTNVVPTTSGTFNVVFQYNSPQALKYGKDNYIDSHGKTYYYKELVFSINNTNGESDFRVYIKPYYEENSSNGSTDVQYNGENYTKYYTLSADFTNLYNYLSENGFNQ